MTKIIYSILLSGMLSAGLLAPTTGRQQGAQSGSIAAVLRAHNAAQASSLTASASKALKLEPYEGSPDGKSHNFFVHVVSVVARGESFRCETGSFEGQMLETYVSDGAVCSRLVAGPNGLVNSAKRIGESQLRIIEASVSQFGIIPLLQRLSDPLTEVRYLGRTESGDDRFEVKMPSGIWTVLADQTSLIRRLEIGKTTIVFSSYRSVQGVLLPFNERVMVDGKPFYELGFVKITLNPKLDGDLFNSSEKPGS